MRYYFCRLKWHFLPRLFTLANFRAKWATILGAKILFGLSASAAISCHDIFHPSLIRPSWINESAPIHKVLDGFEFPESSIYPTSNKQLRHAIYKAYDGKDFYTGENLAFELMHIDHVIPAGLGGLDSYFNYVPTVARHNIAKSSHYDAVSVTAILSLIRLVYAPKVSQYLESTKFTEKDTVSIKPRAESSFDPKLPTTTRITVNKRLPEGHQQTLLKIFEYSKNNPEKISSDGKLFLGEDDGPKILGEDWALQLSDLTSKLYDLRIHDASLAPKTGYRRFIAKGGFIRQSKRESILKFQIAPEIALLIQSSTREEFETGLQNGAWQILKQKMP